MANPNIAAATTITFGNGIWYTRSTLTQILAVDTDYAIKINTIHLCNWQSGAELVDIELSGIGATSTGVTYSNNSSSGYIAEDLSIAAGTNIQILENPIYLVEGDVIKATSANSVYIFMSWEVFNDA